jgi:hypothetical protein
MHGRTPQLTLWTCTTASCVQRATILQNDLAAIGINLQTKRYRDVRAAGNGYDIRDDGWYLDEYDPHNMLGVGCSVSCKCCSRSSEESNLHLVTRRRGAPRENKA